MNGKRIVCGGCWLMDANKRISHWPGEEGIALIDQLQLQTGGPGLNLAVNLKRLGTACALAGVAVLGDDAYGRFILERCAEHGIATDMVCLSREQGTSFTDVLTNALNGKRTFFHSPGANDLLRPGHFTCDFSDVALLHLGAPGILAGMDATGEDGENGWVRVLRTARQAGAMTNMEMVSLPPERTRDLVLPCLPHLDTLIINDAEAGALSGLETVSQGRTVVQAVERSASMILDMGVNWLVAVHFPAGAVLATSRGVLRQPSVNLPPGLVASSTGAGDAFASGLLLGLLKDMGHAQALRLAHAAAAVNLTSMSTNECLEEWPRCLERAEGWGWREWDGP